MRGGSNLWSNIAGACGLCNFTKRAKVDSLTTEQLRRAAEHQAAYLASFERCTDEVVTAGLIYHDILTFDDPFVEDLLDQGADRHGSSTLARGGTGTPRLRTPAARSGAPNGNGTTRTIAEDHQVAFHSATCP